MNEEGDSRREEGEGVERGKGEKGLGEEEVGEELEEWENNKRVGGWRREEEGGGEEGEGEEEGRGGRRGGGGRKGPPPQPPSLGCATHSGWDWPLASKDATPLTRATTNSDRGRGVMRPGRPMGGGGRDCVAWV